MKRLTVLFLGVFLFAGAFAQAECADPASPRQALVIANETYPELLQLTGGRPSADAVQASLEQIDFCVIRHTNLTQGAILDAMNGFAATSANAEIGLIYYWGMGFSNADGEGYLMPVEIENVGVSEAEAEAASVPIEWVAESNQATRARVIIFDSDRHQLYAPVEDDPWEPTSDTSFLPDETEPGGAEIDGPDQIRLAPDKGARIAGFTLKQDVETYVLFATQMGQYGLDDTLFADTFAEEIVSPGDLIRVLGRVVDGVAVARNLGQVPEIAVQGLRGEPLCLVSCTETQAASNVSSRRSQLEAGTCTGELAHGASEAGRYALVIGNNNYYKDDWGRLSEPSVDAGRVADALQQTGFTARTCLNQKLTDLKNETDAFQAFMQTEVEDWLDAGGSQSGRPKPAAFIYFSGHGAADARNAINYIIPTDSEASSSRELREHAVSVNSIADGFETLQATVFMVIDACRNPLKESENKGEGDKGMVRFTDRPNMLIASATQPGEVAKQDSGYAKYLAQEILKTPGEEAIHVFREVRTKVREATNGEQAPIAIDGLEGRFYFQTPS